MENERAKPRTILTLQWLLGVLCAAVVALSLDLAIERAMQPPDRIPSEWEGLSEGIAGAALLILWTFAFAPAAGLLVAMRARSRWVSWAALLFASAVFLAVIAATLADGLDGPRDLRPWAIGLFAAVILLATRRESLAYLGVRDYRPRREPGAGIGP